VGTLPGVLVFDVSSNLGTSFVVAVPASAAAGAGSGGAKALRDAVAAEHRTTHPEYGDVSVTFMYGLRQVPDGAVGVSQWVAVTDTALRHRKFSWLMVALEPSVAPHGDAEALAANAAGAEAFGSPVGMRRINRAAWERLTQERGGMIMSPPGLVAPPHGVYTTGPSPLGMSPLGMPGTAGMTPSSAAFFDAAGPNDNSKSRLGKRTAAQRLEDETAMPPPEAKRAKTGDAPRDAADGGVDEKKP
jgi:hypothetical protein